MESSVTATILHRKISVPLTETAPSGAVPPGIGPPVPLENLQALLVSIAWCLRCCDLDVPLSMVVTLGLCRRGRARTVGVVVKPGFCWNVLITPLYPFLPEGLGRGSKTAVGTTEGVGNKG